jgi:predicted nucleotidyltransferase
MDSLAQAAAALSIPERTLRRAAREGLLRGERISPRRFRITLREEAYLRSHWQLLRTLRRALRTEPNVRLAVLFGSTATGGDHERSDVDLLVALHDPAVGRLAELAQRLSQHIARDIQLVRLAEAEKSPLLMADAIKQGRVLVDRENRWPDLQQSAKKWQRRARHAERPLSTAVDEQTLDQDTE